MFRLLICSLTHHHITANGRFPKEWNSSSESHWLTEAEQVDGKIERTSGMRRRKGKPNVRLCEKRERGGGIICKLLQRREWSSECEEEVQTQTSAAQRWLDGCVISGRMELTQRWGWQPSLAGPSQAAAIGWGRRLTFRRMHQTISHSSTARSQLFLLFFCFGHNHTTGNDLALCFFPEDGLKMNSCNNLDDFRTFRWRDYPERGEEFVTVDSAGEAW